MNPMASRAWRRRQAVASPLLDRFALDVRDGLTARPKRLPCQYLYDDLGSALFEAITLLPEYGVTRAEERLLRASADSIAEKLVPGVMVAELGSGGGKKTDAVLRAILSFQAEVAYLPIDISPSALTTCAQRLGQLPGVRVRGIEALYLDGLREIEQRRERWPPLLVLFLGGNVGNFDTPAAVRFLSDVRDRLRPGDALLVGADLRKPVDRLLAAYDDPAGVTAAFNLNLLGRINRELGGTFDLRAFQHQARWCESESRVEMHLVSTVAQRATVGACDLSVSFEAGETIWTESSYKYGLASLDSLGRAAGFLVGDRWTDEDWGFAENLWRVG
jgi:dimethylhistidine N-methyltransferase